MRLLSACLALALTACGQQASPPTAEVAHVAAPAPVRGIATGVVPIEPAAAEQLGLVIELLPQEPRAPHENGSAVILLADPAAGMSGDKNLALCHAAFAAEATRVETARPLYWLARHTTAALPSEDPCPMRLEAYDYGRALRIKRKLGLAADGPFLIAERADRSAEERIAAVIDLSHVRAADSAAALTFFRQTFAQGPETWDARTFARGVMTERLARFAGEDAAPLALTPRLVQSRRNIGCPLNDLLDQCAE